MDDHSNDGSFEFIGGLIAVFLAALFFLGWLWDKFA